MSNGGNFVVTTSGRSGLLAVGVAALAMVAMGLGCARPDGARNAAADATSGSKAPTKSDADILADVKRAFAADPDLRKQKIQVEVKDGRVTLVGTVDDGAVRIKAEDKARAVPEVFGVDAERLLVE